MWGRQEYAKCSIRCLPQPPVKIVYYNLQFRLRRKVMAQPIRFLPAVFLLLAALPPMIGAQTGAPRQNDTNTALHLLNPEYPVPYGPMKPAQITGLLQCTGTARLSSPALKCSSSSKVSGSKSTTAPFSCTV